MRAWTTALAALTIAIAVPSVAVAAPEPGIVVIGADFHPFAVNDSGQVAGFDSAGAARWSGGEREDLLPASGGTSSGVRAIANDGTVVGTTNFPPDGGPRRATKWTGEGPGTVITSSYNPDGAGAAVAISADGSKIAGTTTYCTETYCSAPAAVVGSTAFTLVGPEVNQNDRSSAATINSAGVAAGTYSNQTVDTGAVFPGGAAYEPIGQINPRRILDDGTIIGDRYGSGGTVIRRAGQSAFENVPCGSTVFDGNAAGDILVRQGDSLAIWHDGACYRLDDLAPDGWTFPSVNEAGLNGLGQIAVRAVAPGGSASNNADYRGVLFTPRYPFAVTIGQRPTGQPGEFEFETQVTNGNADGVVTTWDFGDGTSETGNKITKRFTKPGTFTVKSTVKNAASQSASSSTTVVVPAPRLLAGIVVPGRPDGILTVGDVVSVDVTVGASADGVGDLSEVTFQGGTFTADPGGVLAYTTGSTSPFTLSPGAGNDYPLQVKVAAPGKVQLATLVIGKDAIGRPVSTRVTLDLEARAAGAPATPGGPLPVPPADTTGPVIPLPAAGKPITATRSGVVPIRFGPMAEDTTGVLSLKTDGKVKAGRKKKVLALGTKAFQALAGQKIVVKVKLGRAGRKLLVKQRRLKVQANITLRDARGNATVKAYKLTIKAPKRKR